MRLTPESSVNGRGQIVIPSALAWAWPWLGKDDPSPYNGVWIAALALQHGRCVFTKNKHFKEVDGLELLRP